MQHPGSWFSMGVEWRGGGDLHGLLGQLHFMWLVSWLKCPSHVSHIVTEETTESSGSAGSLARLWAHQVSSRLRRHRASFDAGTRLGGLTLPGALKPDSPETVELEA